MDEKTKTKLIFIRDEVFGPNSTIYECVTDEELFSSYTRFVEDKQDGTEPWWQVDYKTKNGLFAWGKFQLEMEAEFLSREGIGPKNFLKEITKRWNLFKKFEKKYLDE